MVTLLRPKDSADAQAAVASHAGREPAGSAVVGAIARGRGRSYGDAAQLTDGHVLDMTGLSGFALDAQAGVVATQAGVTIGALLRALVPGGWMLPVVPGTQHVTVGGAIASDVHGKNHGAEGSFARHVEELELLTSSGELLQLRPERDRALFSATTGGMGLTGVVTAARIRLQPITSASMAVDSDRVNDLDEALTLLAASGPNRHRIAWIDMLGSTRGRGIVTRADHLPAGADAGLSSTSARQATVRPIATVPARWPAGALRAATVRIYNELRYRRAPQRERASPQPLGAHLFPLDALEAWPRLYGSAGLIQYQFALPEGQEQMLALVMQRFQRARVPCFLATLKRLGGASGAPLSFPLAGWTLALDLPRSAPGAEVLLDSVDELVAGAGGRVYLTKDARLKPGPLAAMYPRLEEWRAARDAADPERLWRSDLALRTELIARGQG